MRWIHPSLFPWRSNNRTRMCPLCDRSCSEHLGLSVCFCRFAAPPVGRMRHRRPRETHRWALIVQLLSLLSPLLLHLSASCLPAAIRVIASNQKWQHRFSWDIFSVLHTESLKHLLASAAAAAVTDSRPKMLFLIFYLV